MWIKISSARSYNSGYMRRAVTSTALGLRHIDAPAAALATRGIFNSAGPLLSCRFRLAGKPATTSYNRKRYTKIKQHI
jgi:hypothetical protein